MTDTNQLELKSISALLDESFFIPAYQRGYRWTPRQVTELLDDISEFQKKSEEGPVKSFYCLQPVVVKKHGDSWELVDGQQRLTTIYIILSCLIDLVTILGKKRYPINYETRPNSSHFLDNIDELSHKENIDFFHMYEAKQAVIAWFANRDGTYKLKFLQALLNDDSVGKNVKVIWYQINEDIEPTAVFTRLNMGKIPLKNAELVKALFLKASNFDDIDRHLSQLKIANEWDEIERFLQQNAFWFFISNDPQESNRIEFILNLVAKGLSKTSLPVNDPSFVFLRFSEWMSEKTLSIEGYWHEVKSCFMTLREWYDNNNLFHMIGFLIARDVPVQDLLALFKSSQTKQEFHRKLVALVFNKAITDSSKLYDFDDEKSLKDCIAEYIESLSYESSKPKLVAVLLLFNIATLLANPETNSRFQFDQFKKDSWDIEHIRSVASEMPKSKEIQKKWLEALIEYLNEQQDYSSSDLSDDFKKIHSQSNAILNTEPFDSESFEELFNLVLEIYMPDNQEDSDNSIGNLTLLDSSTNRSYKNAIFPIKRNRIIKLDKSASFVPICTKNVFLKYYSNHVDNIMFWQIKDTENHKNAMVESITSLFLSKGNGS